MSANIVLISFYIPKSLGVKYLENALAASGYEVTSVFFKRFNSINPKEVTETEISLLVDLIKEKKPLAIGLSVMASVYLDQVYKVNERLRKECAAPVIWGGVYPTIFPEKCLDYADFVIRNEGEGAIVALADMLKAGGNDFSRVQNLVYRQDGEIVHNELAQLITALDQFGVPTIGGDNKYVIENDQLIEGDPGLHSFSYETSCSRGCPFACTYCSVPALRKASRGCGTWVRFRQIDDVIAELKSAKAKMKKLKFIRFWDEIFCDDLEWVKAFVEKYKEIGLPFEIWGHPLRIDEQTVPLLKKAGLYKVVMGIQSGSPTIRREIFKRPEKQEQILAASRVLTKYKVPQVIYDLMLRHPFETAETMKETYELCKELEKPFSLQMHGLNFLPGTDIVQKAINANLVSPEEMDNLMYGTMQELYDRHWSADNADETINYYYKLTFLTQFSCYRSALKQLEQDPTNERYKQKLEKLYEQAGRKMRRRHIYKKIMLFIKGTF